MKVVDKLREIGIAVPDSAHTYCTGKGCMLVLPLTDASGMTGTFKIGLTSEQYEGLMSAGLAGQGGWNFNDPYVHPTDRMQHIPRAPATVSI